ncbi:Serine/arginine repetitive matrix protein 5 [Microtus ochrogaster]|uniref:Serine/arginine repetitive matrix protein 5 n=1 Tax=Microtus ochrogaster TaxID=79684 RepID=A0A8J6GAR4_MICOH|nr:Serine/arginine repetitive matrix protein 5 [Microtus ochrogaster]
MHSPSKRSSKPGMAPAPAPTGPSMPTTAPILPASLKTTKAAAPNSSSVHPKSPNLVMSPSSSKSTRSTGTKTAPSTHPSSRSQGHSKTRTPSRLSKSGKSGKTGIVEHQQKGTHSRGRTPGRKRSHSSKMSPSRTSTPIRKRTHSAKPGVAKKATTPTSDRKQSQDKSYTQPRTSTQERSASQPRNTHQEKSPKSPGASDPGSSSRVAVIPSRAKSHSLSRTALMSSSKSPVASRRAKSYSQVTSPSREQTHTVIDLTDLSGTVKSYKQDSSLSRTQSFSRSRTPSRTRSHSRSRTPRRSRSHSHKRTHNRLPQSREAKLGDVQSRVLGEAAKDSRGGHPAKAPRAPVMQRGCIARFPACPAHPEHGHSPTPAAPARARRWRLQGRALRLRSESLGERASERESEGRAGLRARARPDGPFVAVGGKRGSETRAACRARAGAGVGLRSSRPRWTWYSPQHRASNGAGERGGADAPYK